MVDREQNAQDKVHQETYESIMRFSGRVGTPAALALTVFFTTLLVGWSVVPSILAMVLVFLVVHFIAKTFF